MRMVMIAIHVGIHIAKSAVDLTYYYLDDERGLVVYPKMKESALAARGACGPITRNETFGGAAAN